MRAEQNENRPSGIFTYSSDAIAPSVRANHYLEAVSRIYPGVTIDRPVENPVSSRMKSIPFADARITEFFDTPNSVVNRPDQRLSGRCHLVLHLGGAAQYRQAGHEEVPQTGDMMLLDTDQVFEASYPSGMHLMIWELPQELLAPLMAEPDNTAGCLISGGHGTGAVLSSYAQTLASQAIDIDARERRILVGHLCSLVALTLGSVSCVQEVRHLSHRAAQRQRVLAYIEAHFRDCGLSATYAARDLKFSRRWLYNLLDDEEIGFAAWVSRRRIEECRKLLTDPVHDHLSITEIAFCCGFGELSTFNRRFRAQCGMTPREFRRNREAISPNGAS